VKKLTVIGIIGNTQGVNKAANPEKKAIKNMVSSPFFAGLLFMVDNDLLSTSFFSVKLGPEVVSSEIFALNEGWFAFVPAIENAKSISVGGKQLESSHTINSTEPAILKVFSVSNLMRCLKTALFSKYLISMSKTGSCTVWPFSSEGFPINLKSGVSLNEKEVGIGPFSGTFWAYKCHFASIVAVATKSYSVSVIFSVEVDHFTGS